MNGRDLIGGFLPMTEGTTPYLTDDLEARHRAMRDQAKQDKSDERSGQCRMDFDDPKEN